MTGHKTRKNVFISQLADAGISNKDLVSYLVLVLFCFLSFNHADITHTIGCSFALLSGHFKDFYEFNASSFGQLNYLPSTYIVFAIWGLPLKLFGGAIPLAYPSFLVVLWYKLLTTLFFAASGYLFYRIVELIASQTRISKTLSTWIWMTSPVALFSQFIFGQYDIITVFFTLLGLFYWLKGSLYKFSIIFGIAITFKYFPVFLFLPLLLIIEKRPSRIIANSVLFALPVAIEAMLFWSSQLFHDGVIGFEAASRVGVALVTIGSAQFNLIHFIFFSTAFAAFLVPRPESCIAGFKTAIRLASFSCFLIFLCLQWHPQWIIFLTPLLALLIVTGGEPEKLLWLDLLFSISFIGYTVCYFHHNVDQVLWKMGIFGSLNPHKWPESHPIRHFILFRALNIPGWMALFDASLLAILVGNIFSFKLIKKGDGEYPASKLMMINRYRLFLGLGVFILPAVWTFIVSVKAR